MSLIHIINPNSSVSVTDTMQAAARAHFPQSGDRMHFAILQDGPAGIASQADADRAATLVFDYIDRNRDQASAFVIGCFSDPGLFAARDRQLPVVGIGVTGIAWAAALSSRVGVVAMSQGAIPRHMRHYAALGLSGLIVGERGIDLPAAETGGELALARIIEAATALRDRDGAEVIVMGCAGMSRLRADVEQAIGLPVVDPVVAGITLALDRAG